MRAELDDLNNIKIPRVLHHQIEIVILDMEGEDITGNYQEFRTSSMCLT